MLLGLLLGVSLAIVVSSLALLVLGLGGGLVKTTVTGAVVSSSNSSAFADVSGFVVSLLVLSLITTAILLHSLKKHRSIFEQHF